MDHLMQTRYRGLHPRGTRNQLSLHHLAGMDEGVGPELRIGISGWTYPGWRGIFHSPGLPHRRELEYAGRQMNSIEREECG